MEFDPLLSQNGGVELLSMDTFTPPPSTRVIQDQSKKCATKRQRRDTGGRLGVSQRGPNWNEDDSIILIKAYQYAEERKKGIYTLKI